MNLYNVDIPRIGRLSFIVTLLVPSFLCTVGASAAQDISKLIFVKESDSGCTLSLWDSQSIQKPVSLPLPECPTSLLGLTEKNAVLVTTKKTIQEIRLTPILKVAPSIKLPVPPIKPGNFPAQPIIAGFTKEGFMTLVMESYYPFDDTDNFVYVLKEGGWVLDKTVYCRRFDSCRFPSISGHSDNSLQSREQHKIWHGFQLKNPFVVDREVLRYQEANGESSEVGGHLTFSFKGSKSVLTYHTLPGPDTGATLTFNIGLQINGGESIELSNAQCETELVGKYLLLYKFWGEGTELVDIETGKSLFGKLKFADWLY